MIGCAALAVALHTVTALAGPSATTPPLGPATWLPAYDLGLHPADLVVTIASVLSYVVGAAAIWAGLRAVRLGWTPRPRQLAWGAVLLTLAVVLVPPSGSADHLSYAAYGRITALDGNAYVTAPDQWPGRDPVVSAAEVPWADTTSVYGPVATAVFTAVSAAGGDSLRLTVWIWQLVTGAGFLLTGLILHRMARGDQRLQARGAVIWTLNPLLICVLVGGAHLDVVGIAAVMACIWLATSPRAGPVRFVLAGVAAGIAAGVKFPDAAVALAVLWALRGAGARVLATATAAGIAGAAAVLIPAHVWAGPHVYDQARIASRYVALSSPWRFVINAAETITGPGIRAYIPLLFVLLACCVAIAAARLLLARDRPGSNETGEPQAGALGPGVAACQALLVLSMAYPVAAPYTLPWYDAIVWAPLALVAVPATLEVLLLARLTTLAIAYVPGRAAVPPSGVIDAMLGVRAVAAPVVVTVLLGWLLTSGARRKARASPASTSGRAIIAVAINQSGPPHSQDH
jgi:hypothetical protein